MGCEWLEHLYCLEADGQHDAAVDMVFDQVDELLRQGAFPTCDSLLQAVDVERLGLYALIAFLAATNAAKKLLVSRPTFFQRVRTRAEVLAPQRASRLVSGLG